MWNYKTFTVVFVISANVFFGKGISIPSCIRKQKAIENNFFLPSCDTFIKEPEIFLFLPEERYEGLLQNLRALTSTLLSSQYCAQIVRTYVCNYFFPPCDGNGVLPLGVCQEECENFILMGSPCPVERDFLLSLNGDYEFQGQCTNTLQLVEDFNVSVNASLDCVNVTEIVSKITSSIQESTQNDLQIADSSSASLVVIVVPTMVVLALLTTILVTISVLSLLWWKRKRYKLMEEERCSRAVHSNTYRLNGLTTSNTISEEEVPLFKISVDDVIENPRLKHAVVSFHCLKFLEEIGHGSFGSVFQGKYTPNPEENPGESVDVAVKTIKNSSASYVEIKGFLEESVVMCRFDHPHVLGLIGICLDPSNSPHLLLPLMENGDLKTYLKNKRDADGVTHINQYPQGLNYDVLLRICLEIAQGMEYLASKRLVHRDLAARNCMLDGNLSVRVADFGLTRDIYETDYYRQTHQGRVPIKWMAPESLHDRISNEKTDVWSYGVTCWEIFSLGRIPYPSVSNTDIIDYLEKGRRLKKPQLCPKVLYALLKTCWSQDPQSRPDFSQLCFSLQDNLPDDKKSKTKVNGNKETPSNVRANSETEGQSKYMDIVHPAEEIIRDDTRDQEQTH